jgi:hypothetical protein
MTHATAGGGACSSRRANGPIHKNPASNTNWLAIAHTSNGFGRRRTANTGRLFERQANTLAAWATTTAANAAPEAASSAGPVGKLCPRLGGAEHAEHPEQQRPVDERFTDRRLVEHIGARRLGAERERRQQVGADVEAEDLQHAEGQRDAAAAQGPHHERGQLGHVVGEVIGEEATDVVVGGAAMGDGGDDGGEVVVEQHEVGRLAGHVAA